MKSIKDWVFSQIISKSLVSSRPLPGSTGFFAEESLDEEFGDRGITLFLPLLTLTDFLYASKLIVCMDEEEPSLMRKVKIPSDCVASLEGKWITNLAMKVVSQELFG
ncbi:hypothetical protein CK203_074039 [Vitis vinifera]|uniref:Uncharacterized protein n=1 Tax=Vitis vinifera TaxID=29760 RepID=A0A438E7Q7_VITVI|nr:hypothetical protein CK203_074039 [Vitis vinifera]